MFTYWKLLNYILKELYQSSDEIMAWHACDNGAIWQHKITSCQSHLRIRQCTAMPSVCPVHKYTRVALGEMGLKTGGKSAVGTDEAQ